MSDSNSPFIPLLASSLLNAVYLRILTTKTTAIDENTWKVESAAVIQQWQALIPQLEKYYSQPATDPISVAKLKEKLGKLLIEETQQLQIVSQSLTEATPDVKLKVAFLEMKLRFLQEMIEILKNP